MGVTKVDFANNKNDIRYGNNAPPHYSVWPGINVEMLCTRCGQKVIKKVGLSQNWTNLYDIVETGVCPNETCTNRVSEDMFRCIWFSNCRYEVDAVPEANINDGRNSVREHGVATQLTKYSNHGTYGRNRKYWLIRLKAFRRDGRQ